MFRNYLTAALRNLVRNRLYTVINVVGLSVGFAAALLIALFVRDEYSFDRWVPGYAQVYRVAMSVAVPGSPIMRSDGARPQDAATFRATFPEVAAIARLGHSEHGMRHGAVEANETVVWADPDIFAILPLPVIAGDLTKALRQPDAVVLTRAVARKYFGRDDVIGQSLEIDHKQTLQVTAVIEDMPSQSHLRISILASGENGLSTLKARGGGVGDALTYFRVRQLGDAGIIAARLSAWVDAHNAKPAGVPLFEGMEAHDLFRYRLDALTDIHLLPPALLTNTGPITRPTGTPQLLLNLSAIGLAIVAMAVMNFINLMTARAGRRSVEVGVRKVTGAYRHDLIIQFIGEALVYVAAGMAGAILLALQVLPAFGAFLDRTITLDLTRDPTLAAALIGFAAGAALLGGLYPAFVLSSFRPGVVLKAGQKGGAGSDRVRQGLVVLQFAVLIGLTLATIIVNRQTVFATGAGLRLDTDQVLLIASDCQESLRNEIAALPGVTTLSCSTGSSVGRPGGGNLTAGVNVEGVTTTLMYTGIDAGFLEIFGLKPVAGRFYAGDRADDGKGSPKNVVINESAVHMLRFESPEAAIGKPMPYCAPANCGEQIIGVAPDFPLQSVREAIYPTIFVRDRPFNVLVAKLAGNQTGETLQNIDRIWKSHEMATPIQREFYDQHIQEMYVDLVRQTQAFTAFAAIAVVIAGLGLIGLSAFAAESCTKEIGIRKSMGASRLDILRLLMWQFTKPVLWSNAIAWPVGYFAMRRWLEGFAYHVDLEPWAFLVASALAAAIAALTVVGHAFLVARAEPVKALRYE